MSPFFRSSLPPVIIILRVYNNAATLAETLASIENQAYPSTRLVVVMEPCIDDSPAILRRFVESATVGSIIIGNSDYLGPAKCFNRALLWVAQECKKALNQEQCMLFAGIPAGVCKGAGIAILDGQAHIKKNRLVAPMVELGKNPDVHLVYGNPDKLDETSVPAAPCHVNGWTLRLWWLINLKTAAIFDTNNEYLDGWPTFVQLLGAGPTTHVDLPLFSYHPNPTPS